jgi:hypothetical protein
MWDAWVDGPLPAPAKWKVAAAPPAKKSADRAANKAPPRTQPAAQPATHLPSAPNHRGPPPERDARRAARPAGGAQAAPTCGAREPPPAGAAPVPLHVRRRDVRDRRRALRLHPREARAGRARVCCCAASLPWSPGPCSPTVFRSAICDRLSLNGFFSLRSCPPLESAEGPASLRAGGYAAVRGCARGPLADAAGRAGARDLCAQVHNRLKPGEDTFFPRERMQYAIDKVSLSLARARSRSQLLYWGILSLSQLLYSLSLSLPLSSIALPPRGEPVSAATGAAAA